MIIVVVNGFYDVGERPSQTCERYTEPLGQGILYSRMRVVPLPRLSLQVFPAFLVFTANYTQLSTASMVELVERRPTNLTISGSIPGGDTIYITFFCRRYRYEPF